MEDDHVDRPGVEERQRLKLTGTNSSIGLIVLITCIHPTKSDGLPALTHERPLQGLCSARAPENRRRAVALTGFARRQNAGVALAQKRRSSDRAATILRIALEQLLDLNVRFADLVVMAERLHPIPFRTRP